MELPSQPRFEKLARSKRGAVGYQPRFSIFSQQIHKSMENRMNDKKPGFAHWSFWAIGIVALIWNVMGVVNFIMQMNPDMLATMSESQRAIIGSRPMWATVAFAIAVIVGSAGCLFLLLRKSTATYLFVVSLVAMIVHMIPYLGMSAATFEFGLMETSMFILAPLAVATFLLWYSWQARNKGRIR